MGYSAGNLELSILGFSDKAVASVDVTTKALRRLASAVELIEKTNLTQAGLQLNYIFKEIANSTNQINTQNIENLAVAAKSLVSISKLSNLKDVDFNIVGNGFKKLARDIEPFIKKVNEGERSLVALNEALRNLRLGTGKNSKIVEKTIIDNGGGFGFAKIGVSLYLMRRMGRFMGNLVQAGSDYNETLNLWQVAMRNNLDVADQFVNKMQKAYGISTKTLMNAQAIFKNMVGNLGNVSDATAYALSEALVQMSVDFSSLYNVKLNEAFNKMQAMLARQVRPIRSVSGYDITENTIYELYQTLGGTKTMRQLNNTEKQLLSIYAVFKQMGASGALGDMTKTLNTFANQSRMMTEYWAELKTWSGLLLKDLLDQWQVLIYINAALITMTEVVKAIAKSRGLGDENFLTGMFETAEATNDEVDELQGKLLDFDKFRSLEGASASPLAIDEKLLQAISGYSSKIDQAQNSAKKLAETWLEWWISEDGGLTTQAKIFLDTLDLIAITLGVIVGASMISSIAKLATTFGLAGASMGFLIMGISTAIYGVIKFISSLEDMSALKVAISLFIALAGAIAAAAISMQILGMNWAGALGVAGVVAGGVLAVSSAIPNFENGASDIDSGTVFRAGEFGKTEAVYTGSNGKTNVANVKQIEQAQYNALVRYHSQHRDDDRPIVVYLDGEKVYENTTAKAKSRGNVWAKV